MTLQSSTPDLRVVGRELNVRYVVGAEIRGSGDRRVVAATLADTADARQHWSRAIEFDSTQVAPKGERDAALRLVRDLRSAVFEAEAKRVSAPGSRAGGAMELTLRADALPLEGPNWVNNAIEARKLYDEALKIDPNLVPALLGRAWTLETELRLRPDSKREDLLPQLEDATNRALALDPADAGVWRFRGDALALQWRWDAALEAYARSVRLDPSRTSALEEQAWTLMWMGRIADAIAGANAVLERDPNADNMYFMQCRSYILLERPDDAIAACSRGIAGWDIWYAHLYLAAAYAQRGDMTKAAAEKDEVLKRLPGFTVAASRALARKLTDAAAFWEQAERTMYPALRKAGFPDG